ncbi:MAG: hypothetical protein IJE63_05345, partial [Clostridia bacterium]|nr:hypothetical protein [Clostridia bacterium]
MDAFFAKIVSFITAIFTMFSLIFTPAKPVEGEFDEVTPVTKQAFDEGEFTMGEYDIVVSPDGNDANDGSLENPLKTVEAAKEKAKASSADSLTVWFREGTYNIYSALEFTAEDKSGVLYRSYPGEEVIFSGAEEISGNWSETTINGVKAFVTDMPIESDADYFYSLFKDGKRLSRSNYPKDGVFKIADPITDEGVPSDWSPDFFTHTVAFIAHTKDLLNFSNVNDVDVRVMHYWCDELLPIHSVNTSTGRIEVSKVSSMTLRVDDNYIFENVKEALSLPGEWYLDRSEEKLYYIPQDGDTVDNTVLYAGGCEQLITLDGVEGISFQGINFEKTDWSHIDGTFFDESMLESSPMYGNIKYGGVHPQAAFEIPSAIYITASSGVNFTDCRFENISYTAVKFDKASTDCNVTSCYFNEIGANAVFIHGDFVVPANTQR